MMSFLPFHYNRRSLIIRTDKAVLSSDPELLIFCWIFVLCPLCFDWGRAKLKDSQPAHCQRIIDLLYERYVLKELLRWRLAGSFGRLQQWTPLSDLLRAWQAVALDGWVGNKNIRTIHVRVDVTLLILITIIIIMISINSSAQVLLPSIGTERAGPWRVRQAARWCVCKRYHLNRNPPALPADFWFVWVVFS